ncbi:NAD(P)H nitroreductase [Nocardia sp.]|uniref:Acg family FMN-binding oxidoreductase n=1 Tax=Nocardia sp. TaxID=1821 RepID=UPI00258DF9A8|nr:NAD(P)H nitroreductase [Nocardia sp.]
MNAPPLEVVENAVTLAGHAPSLHNSQPWRWSYDGTALRLFAVTGRELPSTDIAGRQLLISCGVVLDHLRTAMAATGWRSWVSRFPDPNRRDHLATVEFRPVASVTDRGRDRAEAIARRRTDRLPLAAPADWDRAELVVRAALDPDGAVLDVLPDDSRGQLVHASELAAEARGREPGYRAELLWWTGHAAESIGIPPEVLTTGQEGARVGIGRELPTVDRDSRRMDIDTDHSAVLVLSTENDSSQQLLRCGESLSTVLLECTVAGYATCPLTHLTELPRSRAIVSRLTGRAMLPQVLVRVGTAPGTSDAPPATPRLALEDIFEIRRPGR